MAQYANAVAAKIKARYGKRLTPAQYDELAHKQNIREVAAFLKEKTPYSLTLEELRESDVRRELLESMLHRDSIYQYAKLVHYAGKSGGIYRWVIVEIEVGLILKSLREMFFPIEADAVVGLPMFVQDYIRFDLLALAKVKTIEELVSFLKDTPFAAVIAQCNQKLKDGNPDEFYSICETVLRSYYYQMVLDSIKKYTSGQARKQLEELALMRAELRNIKILYRIKSNFQMTAKQIRQRMLPFYGKIKPRLFERMIQADNLQEFMRLLQETFYGGELVGKDMFEDEVERICCRQLRRLMRFATEPQVIFTAYMLLHGIEVENLTRIVEGIRYGLGADQIKSLLCL